MPEFGQMRPAEQNVPAVISVLGQYEPGGQEISVDMPVLGQILPTEHGLPTVIAVDGHV